MPNFHIDSELLDNIRRYEKDEEEDKAILALDTAICKDVENRQEESKYWFDRIRAIK